MLINIKHLCLFNLILALTLYSLSTFAATIQVTAQIGDAGCDLVDAIITANSNTPTGGCIANNGSFVSGERDLIALNFDAPISEFVISSVHMFDNGLPSIQSDIAIIGRGGLDKVVIKRSEELTTPEFRLLTITESGSLSLENISLQNGKISNSDGTPRSGGAILVQGGILEVSNCVFLNNQSSLGGAIALSQSDPSTVTVRETFFSNNQSTATFSGGGAILNSSGELTIIDSEFVDNNSLAIGGALALQSNSTTDIRNTLFADNVATDYAGAIGIGSNAVLSILDSTISNNTALDRFSYGGGIGVAGGANDLNISIINTTLSENTAYRGGGIGIDSLNDFTNSTLAITNSLITGNLSTSTSPSGHEIATGSQTIDLIFRNNLLGHAGYVTEQAISGSNLILDNTNILATSDGDTPTSLSRILLPLTDNGGLTKTHALPVNSPAIDAATDGTIVQAFVFTVYAPGCRGVEPGPVSPLPPYRKDQRGYDRPLGNACDIGAYEAEEDSPCFVLRAKNDAVVAFCL